MEFLIAGLLVLDLAVTLVSVQLLERESRRQFIAVRDELAKATGILRFAITSLRELRLDVGGMEDRSRADIQALREKLTKTNDALSLGNNIFRELEHVMAEAETQRKDDVKALREEISAKADAWLAGEADTVKSLSGLWKESQRQTAALQSLLSRGDASEAVRELARQLEDSPSLLGQEEESALSKAMEEGISNILGFSAGRTSEGRT